MMEKIRRERRSADAWREIVTRQEQSGLSVHDFCQQEGLEPASLYAWRSRARREIDFPQTQVRVSRKPPQRKIGGEFIDLGSLDSKRSRFEVRLDLGGGVLLQLVRG